MDVMFLYPQALGRQHSSEMTAGILARTPELPQDLGGLLQPGEEKPSVHSRFYTPQRSCVTSGLGFPVTQPGQPHDWGFSQALVMSCSVTFWGVLCPENATFKAATAIRVQCTSFPDPAFLSSVLEHSPWPYTQKPRISPQ